MQTIFRVRSTRDCFSDHDLEREIFAFTFALDDFTKMRNRSILGFAEKCHEKKGVKTRNYRKKLKSVLRVRFHDRLDTESDMAIESFRASCVSIFYTAYNMQFLICFTISAKIKSNFRKKWQQ